MPREIFGLDKYGIEQHDMHITERTGTGPTGLGKVMASKILDITDLVPTPVTQAVIKYGRDSKGDIIVQFQDRKEIDSDKGLTNNTVVNEGLGNTIDGMLEIVTETWGFKPADMIRIVVENLPR